MAESYIEKTFTLRRVTWAAVFAGVVITLVVQALLTLLGIGIGAASVEPLRGDPGKGLGIGAAIWFLVSTLIAVYLGAMVAGKMSGATRRSDRMLHGLLTWGTSAIIGVLSLTTAAGTLLGGTGALMGGAGSLMRTQPAQADAPSMSGGSATMPLTPTGRETGTQVTEQQAREAADKAAKGVAQAALWSFALLAISGLVAAWGASPKRDAADREIQSAPSS